MVRSRSSKKGGCWGGRRRRTMKGGAYGVGAAIAPGAVEWDRVNITGPVGPESRSAGDVAPNSEGGPYAAAGGRRRSRKTRRVIKKKSVATIKRLLKAKGLKVSGSRRAVTARARKARIPLKGGGAVTGTPYQSYTGQGSRGLTDGTSGAHEVNNNVLSLPGWGPGSSQFIQTQSGGLSDA